MGKQKGQITSIGWFCGKLP